MNLHITRKLSTGGGILVLLIILFCSSCYSYIIPLPVPEKIEWTVTIRNEPSEAFETSVYTIKGKQPFTLPELESTNGYELDYYTSNDGTILEAGETIEYEKGVDNVQITAHWLKAYTLPDSNQETAIKDIIASGDDVSIVIPLSETPITFEDPIELMEGQRVVIKGEGLSRMTRAATTAATFTGSITLSEGSSIRLEGLTMKGDENLINSETGDVTIEIVDSTLETEETAVNIVITDSNASLEPIRIDVTNSSIVLSPQTNPRAKGININNDYKNSTTYLRPSHVELDITDSVIESTTDNSIYGISLCYVDSVDMNIEGTTITANKNHYPVYLFACGSDNTNSNVSITNCDLKGYCAYYIHHNSKNITTNILDSTLTGLNYNLSTGYNDFTVLPIHDSENCITNVRNSTINFGSETDDSATMNIFGFQYNADGSAHDGGCEFNFTNTDFNYEGIFEDEKSFAAIDCNPLAEPNTYTMDNTSMNNLLALLPGSHIGIYEEDYPVTDDFIVDYTVYYLTIATE